MITDVGKKIKHIRELKDFSQEFMASQMGISTRAYSKIEAEETKLTIDRLNEISSILGVTPQEVLGFDANVVFNNNPHQEGGEYVANNYNNTAIEQVQSLYERLLSEKDKLITALEKQIPGKKAND